MIQDTTTMDAPETPNMVKITNSEAVEDFLHHLSPSGPLFHGGVIEYGGMKPQTHHRKTGKSEEHGFF